MPAVDWSQVVTVAWGVFIGLMAFAAIGGSFYVSGALGVSIIGNEDAPTALITACVIWLFVLPVSLLLGTALVALTYGLSLAA